MALRRSVSSVDAIDAALSFILGLNSNKVAWDQCQFIWDSRGLIEATTDDEMAIFGAKGKVMTPKNELLLFELRHCLDFGSRPTYRFCAAVEEKPGGSLHELNFRDEDMESGRDCDYFRRRVLDLTEQAKVAGLESAMRSFLTRSEQNGGTALVNGDSALVNGSKALVLSWT
ncbi:hypothetical protein FPOAC2_07545 [Fusarium poae]|uniref:Uncharacterized protein n=1 Tax=Fusarium poae TaxID=36050 RepID=A0A1B8AIN1_FUSPO|nr:hypothetical protein FPOAC1_007633 [Fusarium poae]KAG8668255.1 hypothetical protein FPOAC1_007633 [Fusarium poae]OBS20358.1 hypothetical protein FPOA_06730 [Fusarium poae]